MLATNKYTKELGAAVEDTVNPETIIYLLKNQLVEASIFNHNLKRVVSFLVWKLNMERANATIKEELGMSLEKTVSSLESILEKYSENRQSWKQQLDKYDYDISRLKNQLSALQNLGEFPCSFGGLRPRLRKTINKRVFNKQNTCKLADATGRCLGRLFSPRAYPMLKKQLSNMDFTMLTETANKAQLASPCNRPAEQTQEHDEDLRRVQIDLVFHKARADLLMEELKKAREKAEELRNQVAEIKNSADQAIKDENSNWRLITNTLKVESK